ncbi:Zinc knuckle CX2CX4HX4C [Abeliophyllum distichum]|uniref:Zinc knuckle CX2CX4HX4C n=1 Tax=Abeliophyllum distichum TaxID=126358 RepID=A0ABD1PS14_9LAMI
MGSQLVLFYFTNLSTKPSPILSYMDLHEISSLCANLRLDDDESPAIKVAGPQVCEAMARMELYFVDELGDLSSTNFSKTAFSIHLSNVPLGLRDEKNAKEWSTVIRTVEVVELSGPSIQIRVLVDVSKPFKHGVQIHIEELRLEVTLLIQYRLHDYCYACGLIGQRFFDYDKMIGDQGMDIRGGWKYGNWLWATVSTPSR